MSSIIIKTILIFLLYHITYNSFSQKKPHNLKTSIYAGKYEYGDNIEKGPVGYITVYPESDSTILCFFDLNKGVPTYSMGELYCRLKLENKKGEFETLNDSTCDFKCNFKSDILKVSTRNGRDNCDFGFGIYPDGTYIRQSKKIPTYFIDESGTKYYFNKVKPENWEGD